MKLTKVVAVGAGLLLAACQAEQARVPVAVQLRPGPSQGVDLPTDSSDVLAELRDSRVDFVARYYREPTSRWPALTATEVQRLSAVGKTIVAVWESHSATPSYFSYASGYNDGISAYGQARTVGQPTGSAIYFAVDFNAHELYYVDQYFRGVAAGFAASSGGRPAYKVGVYGSGYICDSMRRAGLAQYSWLSNARAWAGYQSYTGWNIRQSGRLANLTFDHDSNEARGDYGGFRLAAYQPPAPTAGLPPAPPPPPPLEPALVTVLRSWF